MNNISILISVLTIEERKSFVNELKKKNKRNDVKNIELFYLLADNSEKKNIDILLYGMPSKGAYHALCKRLYDSLIDFMSLNSFEEEASEEIYVLKLIMVSKILFEKNQEKLAFKLLSKAEQKAKTHELYGILNDVYMIQIQYSHEDASLVLDELMGKYYQNKKLLIFEERMNIFYASVQSELNASHLNVDSVIYRNLEKFEITIDDGLTYQSLYKILEICNKVGNVSRNYHELLEFVQSLYTKVSISETVKKNHLIYRVRILYYMSNTFFRVKNFDSANLYLNKMRESVSLLPDKYKAVFTLQYDLLKNLILMFTGEVKLCVYNLQNYDFKKHSKKLEYYHDMKLTQVVALFLVGEIKESYRVLNEFHHSDNWYHDKSGIIWVIKKNLIEILLLIELDYLDLVESRIKGFRKKYRNHLLVHDELEILEFVRLINAIYTNPQIIESPQFANRVDALIVKPKEIEDIFKISFYAWLKAKINSRDTYSVCMELVKTNN